MNVLIRGNFRTYLVKQHVSISALASPARRRPLGFVCHAFISPPRMRDKRIPKDVCGEAIKAPEAHNENESVIQKRNQRNKSVIPRICLTIYLRVKNQSKILYFWLRHDCIGHS